LRVEFLSIKGIENYMQETYRNLAQTSLRGGTTKQSIYHSFRLLRRLAMTVSCVVIARRHDEAIYISLV